MLHDLRSLVVLERHQFEREPIALAVFMQELLQRAPLADVDRVVLAVPAGLPNIDANPGHLERILINLLVNASKYSPAETPIILAAIRQDDQVRITLTDHGMGIAPEDLPFIFDRFYRAKGERKVDGVGLGLYICRMLVELNGGTIRVESAPDAGSVFTLTLPVSLSQDLPDEAHPRMAASV